MKLPKELTGAASVVPVELGCIYRTRSGSIVGPVGQFEANHFFVHGREFPEKFDDGYTNEPTSTWLWADSGYEAGNDEEASPDDFVTVLHKDAARILSHNKIAANVSPRAGMHYITRCGIIVGPMIHWPQGHEINHWVERKFNAHDAWRYTNWHRTGAFTYQQEMHALDLIAEVTIPTGPRSRE